MFHLLSYMCHLYISWMKVQYKASITKYITMVTFSNALFSRIRIFLISFILVLIYATILQRFQLDSGPAIIARCSSMDCLHKVNIGYKRKAMLDGKVMNQFKQHGPSFMHDMKRGMKIGMVNMDEAGFSEWSAYGETIPILFDKVSENLKWIDLFTDSDANASYQSCDKIPIPDFSKYVNMDMVVVKVPCKPLAEEWQRDVFRLQLHLVVANMVVKRGKKGAKVVVKSKCRPMIEIFRCEDLLKEEGQWWYYEPDLKRLEQIVSLHLGTCELSQKGIPSVPK